MDGCVSPHSRDPAIKLFGKEIPLLESQIPTKASVEINSGVMKLDQSSTSPSTKAEHKISPDPNNTHFNQSSKSKGGQTEKSDTDQEKTFKKPDKILPCPRCNSLDTKFCYFNNYNVNQPRHFCKHCQRYWTAGGTVRNVPMGSGRRKNKQFASQYHQIMVSSIGMPISNMEISDSGGNKSVTVLKFGTEAPLCDSMGSVLRHGEKNNHEEQAQEISACGCSSTKIFANQSNDVPVNVLQRDQTRLQASCNDLNTHISLPFYPIPPWGFPLNPSWNNVATVTQTGGNSNPAQFCTGPLVAIPGIFPQSIPLQFVTSSYLACRPVLGNMSVSASIGDCISPSSSTSNSGGSPALGKHSRAPSSFVEETQSQKYILVPKTLRIDDPDAVSKNPTWAATLGIMPKHESPLSRRGL